MLATETELSAPQGGGDLCRALGHRALVSPSEALVGRDQSVAAVEGCAGVVDADSLHRVCLDPIAGLALWESFPPIDIAPWRKGAMITAGLFGQWLRIQFTGLRVRDACDSESGQFVMPFPGQDQRLRC